MSRPMKQALITLLLLGTAFSQSGRIVRHTLGGGHKIEVQQDTTSPVTAITSPANSATVTSGIYCSNFLEGLTSLPLVGYLNAVFLQQCARRARGGAVDCCRDNLELPKSGMWKLSKLRAGWRRPWGCWRRSELFRLTNCQLHGL